MQRKFISQHISEMVVNSKYDDIPESVKLRAKYILLDYLGNLIASNVSDTKDIAIEVAEELGGKEESSIIGSTKKVSDMNAALANGIGGYSFDFIDDHNDSKAHLSCSTIATALAVAEKNNKSGKELMEGFMVGNESGARLGAAYLGNMYKRGFHPSGVLATMSSISVASKLMDLSIEETMHAHGLGVTSMVGGLYSWNSEENVAKRLNAGHPARNGILSALLAKRGMTGPKDVYEGRYGAFVAYGHNKEFDCDVVVKDIGKTWSFATASIKPYPACRYCGGSLDALFEITKVHNIDISQIKSIISSSQSAQIENVMEPAHEKYNPKNEVEMQHSLPYCLAVALVTGKFTLDELNTEYLDHEDVIRLKNLVKAEVNDELEALYPDQYSTAVIIEMNDGTRYEGVCMNPLGDWRNPVSDEFIVEKFKSLARYGINDENRIDKILETVLNIENLENTVELIDLINYAKQPVLV